MSAQMLTEVATQEPIFREVQRPFQCRAWILFTAAVTTLAWVCFLSQIVAGQPLAAHSPPDWIVLLFWAVFGLMLPALFVTSHLTTEVRSHGLRVTYFPLVRKELAFDEIEECKAITYEPLRHYGGWGIRVNMDGSWAWSVSGREGVQLVFRGGRRLLIGSQVAEKLATAVEQARSVRTS